MEFPDGERRFEDYGVADCPQSATIPMTLPWDGGTIVGLDRGFDCVSPDHATYQFVNGHFLIVIRKGSHDDPFDHADDNKRTDQHLTIMTDNRLRYDLVPLHVCASGRLNRSFPSTELFILIKDMKINLYGSFGTAKYQLRKAPPDKGTTDYLNRGFANRGAIIWFDSGDLGLWKDSQCVVRPFARSWDGGTVDHLLLCLRDGMQRLIEEHASQRHPVRFKNRPFVQVGLRNTTNRQHLVDSNSTQIPTTASTAFSQIISIVDSLRVLVSSPPQLGISRLKHLRTVLDLVAQKLLQLQFRRVYITIKDCDFVQIGGQNKMIFAEDYCPDAEPLVPCANGYLRSAGQNHCADVQLGESHQEFSADGLQSWQGQNFRLPPSEPSSFKSGRFKAGLEDGLQSWQGQNKARGMVPGEDVLGHTVASGVDRGSAYSVMVDDIRERIHFISTLRWHLVQNTVVRCRRCGHVQIGARNTINFKGSQLHGDAPCKPIPAASGRQND